MYLLIYSKLIFHTFTNHTLKNSTFSSMLPMVKLKESLKFFQFIKLPLTQNLGTNLTMMPNADQDLLAIGQEHQYNLLCQSDLNSCTQYRPRYLSRGRVMLRANLENIDSILSKCKFDLIQVQECVFK
jgi:hypothetical protein